jgi:hypothetical protein
VRATGPVWHASAMRTLFAFTGLLVLLCACDDKKDCNSELMIAVELDLTVPESVTVTKVTAENESERECEFTRDEDNRERRLYACYGQGGGDYIIRIYNGDEVIYTETDEVDANECKVNERLVSEVDLGAL